MLYVGIINRLCLKTLLHGLDKAFYNGIVIV